MQAPLTNGNPTNGYNMEDESETAGEATATGDEVGVAAEMTVNLKRILRKIIFSNLG